jgi:hypothetical protein
MIGVSISEVICRPRTAMLSPRWPRLWLLPTLDALRNALDNAAHFSHWAMSFTTLGVLAVYCDQCGRKLRDGAKFCDACGSPVLGPLTDQPIAAAESPVSAPFPPPDMRDAFQGVLDRCPHCGAGMRPNQVQCPRCFQLRYRAPEAAEMPEAGSPDSSKPLVAGWLSFAGVVAALIGSFGPWAVVQSVFGSITVNGSSRDGAITAALCVVAGAIILFRLTTRRRGRLFMLAFLIEVLVLIIWAADFSDVNDLADAEAGEFVSIETGWGLQVVGLGTVCALIFHVVHLVRNEMGD